MYVGEDSARLVTARLEVAVENVFGRKREELVVLGELNAQAERKCEQEHQRNEEFQPKSRTAC